jgi:inorganic pyrophosphatase
MESKKPDSYETKDAEPPEVEVVVEIPRGSFLKRGSTGQLDFVSPLPCPFNYGSIENLVGLEVVQPEA